MCPKCDHTKNIALLKSIINTVWYQALQNTNKRRNRTFDMLMLAKLYTLSSLYASFQ